MINGAQLKTIREQAGKTLEETADLLGLEPHVLSGVEAGWRSLTMHQWALVVKRLENLDRPVPGASRPPMPAEEACAPNPGLTVGSPDTDLHPNEGADSRG